MPEWNAVEQLFRELEPVLEQSRLERQWDELTEEWRLGGRMDLDAARRFRAAAAEGGRLLDGHPDVPASVLAVTEPENRWFRALWEMAGPHATPVAGMMSMHGKAGGAVTLGRIARPAHLSSKLAARLGAGKS